MRDMDHIRRTGHRLTPQRLAILQILEEAGGHLSPAEIYARAQTRIPGMTEATVYRTLDFLTGHGLAMVAHVGGGRLVYESAGHDHHHLICHACGGTVEIEHEYLETLYHTFLEQKGFEIDFCHVTFFGLCPACRDHKNAEIINS